MRQAALLRLTANGIESIGFSTGHAVYDAIAQVTNDQDQIRASFDALSGEIHASAASTHITHSQLIRSGINQRLRAASAPTDSTGSLALGYAGNPVLLPAMPSERFSTWASAFGASSALGDGANAARLDATTGGFLTGIDGLVSNDLRLGVMAGYSRSTFGAGDRASSGSSDNYHLGLYSGHEWNAFALHTGLAYSWHEIDASRKVAIPGLSDSLSSAYNAGTLQAFGELSYTIEGGGFTIEPFANFALVRHSADGFKEQGGAAALSVQGRTSHTGFPTVGARASHEFYLADHSANISGIAASRHRGIAASRHRGIAASRHRGIAASMMCTPCP